MNQPKQELPTVYRERPTLFNYATSLTVTGVGAAAFALGGAIEKGSNTEPDWIKYPEAALLGSISTLFVMRGFGRYIEQIQHSFWWSVAELDQSVVERVSYGYLSTHFTHEAGLNEAALCPGVQRLYLIPAEVTLKAQRQGL